MKRIVSCFFCTLILGCASPQPPAKEPAADTTQANTDDKAERNPTITFSLPDGFSGRGAKNEYVVYSDSVEKHNGHNVSTIKALEPVDFATILSSIKPMKCIGQRIKYTAWVRAKDVSGWAGLWLRIDPKDPYNNACLGFDNMSSRPINGTREWAVYEIVLDVPEGADMLVYGALLDGGGQIWVDSMDIKIVDKRTPRTDKVERKFPKVL